MRTLFGHVHRRPLGQQALLEDVGGERLQELPRLRTVAADQPVHQGLQCLAIARHQSHGADGGGSEHPRELQRVDQVGIPVQVRLRERIGDGVALQAGDAAALDQVVQPLRREPGHGGAAVLLQDRVHELGAFLRPELLDHLGEVVQARVVVVLPQEAFAYVEDGIGPFVDGGHAWETRLFDHPMLGPTRGAAT